MQESIGIDLGTCNSSVAEFKNGVAQSLINKISQQLTTPSYITYPTQKIGQTEKDDPTPNNTISSFKRLIGRRFDDKEIQQQMQKVNYKIINKNNQPLIQVSPDSLLGAAEVSGDYLRQLKEQTGFKSNKCVITVPAYFSHQQKLETERAGRLAGLNVQRLLAEPTAAALQYNQLLKNLNTNEYIMVVDLGAGTFDVSVLEKQGDVYTVLACAGNNYLGGDDYTNLLQKHLQTKYNSKINFKDAEQFKHLLSHQQQATLENGIIIDKSEIESIYQQLNMLLEKPILQTLSDSQLEKQQISKVLLVGGQTKQPSVQQKVQEITGIKPSQILNPDLCVAQGAAIQAAVLNNQLNTVLLLDATPFSLGIETFGGIFSKILNRNVTLPAKQSQIFTTTENNQEQVVIRIFQGENNCVQQNIFLNEFLLEINPNQPRGAPRIRVEFEIDQNGIVSVQAIDEKTNNKKEVKIKYNDNARVEKSETELLQEELSQKNIQFKGNESVEQLKLILEKQNQKKQSQKKYKLFRKQK